MELFAFDYETYCIQPYLLAPPIVCMSYTIDDGAPQLVHRTDARLKQVLHSALTTPGCVMVAHNLAFEVGCTLAAWPEWVDLVFAKLDAGEMYCTKTAEQLISIGRGDHCKGFSLQECLARHESTRDTLLDKEGHWRLRYGTLASTPISEWPAEAVAYSLGDTSVRELYRAQQASGSKYLHDNTARWTATPRGAHKVFVPGQTWASMALHLTSCNGFPTDPVMADWLYEDTKARIAEYAAELKRVGFLVPVRSKGQAKYQLKKAPAEALLEHAYAAQNRKPPRGEVTPSMLEKAYAAVGISYVYEHKKARGDKAVLESDLQEAYAAGCDMESLRGNLKLDEEACLNAGHPLLVAYTKYKQADVLLGKVRRLKKPLIQTAYNTIVETGRTSSRQGDDPKPGESWTAWGMQIQNLPRAGAEVDDG